LENLAEYSCKTLTIMRNLFAILAIFLVTEVYSQSYSWEIPQAAVLPGGDLTWAPKTFQYEAGSSVRYIDYETGDDTSDGLSTSTPWKHHPWDPNATSNALSCSGIHTYVFKRGVVYRGTLSAKESGTSGDPIRLTSSPDWGSDEAYFFGSISVSGGWQKANSTIAPKIPNPTLVWYKNIDDLENLTKNVCEFSINGLKRLRLARTPNYEYTPDEPQQKWWKFTKKTKSGDILYLEDATNFTQSQVDYYKGGDVWAIEDAIVMCTFWRQKINNYEPGSKRITVADQNFGGENCRYFIENTPYLLDTPGEFYYDASYGRIFLRLEDDKDPNTTIIEVASKAKLIDITNKSYIEISGLTFGLTTYDTFRWGETGSDANSPMPVIRLAGSTSNITIKNCRFLNVNGGIAAYNTGSNLIISDNEMNNMDDFSILSYGPNEIQIMRNKIYESGTRHLGRWYSSIPAIAGKMSVAEIAGNIIEYAWGSGINITWGKGSGDINTVPFIRGIVHHNKVNHSLMGVNDYGGIESWQGGPAYYYNNISGDAQGFHYNWWIDHIMSLGYAFYFDGAFKQYVFNNLVKGTAWNRNASAYMQVLGFYNMYVHNNAYNVDNFSTSGDGNLALDGFNCYLSNISDSTNNQINHTTSVAGVPFDSYGNNIFSGKTFNGNFVTGGTQTDLYTFKNNLTTYNPDLDQVGYETSKRVFVHPASGDYRLTSTSEAIDRGVKFFVPFALSRVVGEWNFYIHRSDPTLIKGENFYFTNEYIDRETYKNVPKNHMNGFGITSNSFVTGNLEDWTEGALTFDGITTYCSLSHNMASSNTCNNVDMTVNSFIIETYFKTLNNQTGGVIVSKYGASGLGYQLDVDAEGKARFSIMENGSVLHSVSTNATINDDEWHHILIEVNRNSGITIYADGEGSNGTTIGTLPATNVSFTNTSDFLVGKNMDDGYFNGIMDFLRISKGTLEEAKTTYAELYKWEFDGPFIKDFLGNSPIGQRDAGAIETGEKACDLSVTPTAVNHEITGGSDVITIEALTGWELVFSKGDFFNTNIVDNTITVTTTDNSGVPGHQGSVGIFGCNETIEVMITQRGYPSALKEKEQNEVRIFPNPVNNRILKINVPDEWARYEVMVTDVNGKVLIRKQLNNSKEEISISFKPGIYFISLIDSKTNYTGKLIVQ
jgi:hypothetical protein